MLVSCCFQYLVQGLCPDAIEIYQHYSSSLVTRFGTNRSKIHNVLHAEVRVKTDRFHATGMDVVVGRNHAFQAEVRVKTDHIMLGCHMDVVVGRRQFKL